MGLSVKRIFPRCIFVCMTQYDAKCPMSRWRLNPVPGKYLWPVYFGQGADPTVGSLKRKKYAHVTFFFNGGVEAPCKTRIGR